MMCAMGAEFAQSDSWSIKSKPEANSDNNMNELDQDSDLYDCEFQVHVLEDQFGLIDDIEEEIFGYDLKLTQITYEHPGCAQALLRLAWTKKRDDPLSETSKFDTCQITDSNGEVLKEAKMTLGTVGEINDMVDNSQDGFVVISATMEEIKFYYEWIVLVDPNTDQALWKGQFYVWEKEAHLGEDMGSSQE